MPQADGAVAALDPAADGAGGPSRKRRQLERGASDMVMPVDVDAIRAAWTRRRHQAQTPEPQPGCGAGVDGTGFTCPYSAASLRVRTDTLHGY